MGLLWSSLTRLLLLSLHLQLSCSSFTSDLFNSWCEQHGKSYSSEEEKLYRYSVFEDNLAFVTNHNNLGNSTYTLALNAFADLTHHEFKSSRLGLSFAPSNLDRSQSQLTRSSFVRDVPSSIDWRKKGAVTPVKDQASCGACWAFSATGAIEGINQIVTGSLVSLSEQELVDCDKSYNSGCEGGLMDYAFQWVIDNKGIDTEQDYSYQAKDKSCNKNKLKKRVVTIDAYTDLPQNEEEIIRAVASQPVSVGLCGSERAFQSYSKGIFNGPCSTSLDHAVLIVGYGSENGVDYWILKNSWGKSWGIDGYMHMARSNIGNQQGICGINMLASYPTKTSPNPPSPPPSPTKCSLLTHCGAGETCCCTRRLLGICFSWKCCELNSAVCCKDHHYCCPQDYPVCDTKKKLCLKVTGNSTMVEGLERRGSFGKLGGWRSLFEAWNL